MKWIPEETYNEIWRQVPRACVDVVLTQRTPNFGLGKVLLLHRVIEPGKDCWCLPGGEIKRGETNKQAAVRKVEEELGLAIDIDDLRLIGVEDAFIPQRHDVVITYTILVSGSPEIKLDFQHDEARWFSIYGLPLQMLDIVRRQINDVEEYDKWLRFKNGQHKASSVRSIVLKA